MWFFSILIISLARKYVSTRSQLLCRNFISTAFLLILLRLMGDGAFVCAKDLSNGFAEQPSNPPSEITLRILDKETGKAKTFTTPLLKPVRYKSLIIRPRSCFKKKVGLAYEINWSFIEVWIQSSSRTFRDKAKRDNPPVHLIFSSWLNSAFPSFSHPQYSILIEDCKTKPSS